MPWDPWQYVASYTKATPIWCSLLQQLPVSPYDLAHMGAFPAVVVPPAVATITAGPVLAQHNVVTIGGFADLTFAWTGTEVSAIGCMLTGYDGQQQQPIAYTIFPSPYLVNYFSTRPRVD